MTVRTASECREAWKYLLEGEVELLHELALSLPMGARIINIGAGAGTSALAFLETRADLRLTTIDARLEPSPLGGLGSEEVVLREAGYWGDHRYRQVHGDSKTVGRLWGELGGDLIDLVFIDGDHSYEGCRGDIEAWAPWVRKGGYIVLHDHGNQIWGDVTRATEDTLDKDPQFERKAIVSITAAYRRRE